MTGRCCGIRLRVLAACAVLAMAAGAAEPAAAQNLFDTLFGGLRRPAPVTLPPQAQSYAATAPASNLVSPIAAPGISNSAIPDQIAPASTGRTLAFCVRTCDGRYFPLERHNGLTPVEACKSFCPASATRVYVGASIDRATARDGSRYGDLTNAFLYRSKLVPGCTCNGRDALGLAPIEPAADPTLRAGDIVATRNGLMVYRGRAYATRGADFSPVSTAAGLSLDERRRLVATEVAPAAVPATPVAALPVAVDAGGRQAQLVR